MKQFYILSSGLISLATVFRGNIKALPDICTARFSAYYKPCVDTKDRVQSFFLLLFLNPLG